MSCLEKLGEFYPVLGYQSYGEIEEEGTYQECDEKIAYTFTILNALSPFLSPIIGIIRLIVAGIFYNSESAAGDEDAKVQAKQHLVRGVLEVLCLGPILAALDILVNVTAKEQCCFKNTEL